MESNNQNHPFYQGQNFQESSPSLGQPASTYVPYSWLRHVQHVPPEAFPTAPGPLVFEGFIPNTQVSQPAQQPVVHQPHFVSSQKTSQPRGQHPLLDPRPSSASLSSSTWVPSNGPAQNRNNSGAIQNDVVQQDGLPDISGGVYAGTRSRKRSRPQDFGGSPKKEKIVRRGGWSKGMKLGPRRTLEPGEEFNKLHKEATNAFIEEHNSEKALVLINQAIAINPEIFSAHALLSEIYFSTGNSKQAIDTLFVGAHTSPKDPGVWQQVADACLQRSTYDRQTSLEQALYAFNRLVQINHDDHDSRFQRAAINKELGKFPRALNELHIILQAMPHNSSVLKLYAEICTEMDDIQKAVDLFKEAIVYYQEIGLNQEDTFTWSDVNTYADLVADNLGSDPVSEATTQDAIQKAIKALKKLSRWLLGREAELFWDQVEEDDREWDAEDTPRRGMTEQYFPNRYLQDSYGIGLPLELRVKLGLLRLRQPESHNEALAHFSWLEPENKTEGAKLFEFPDLFVDVALALQDVKAHDQALRFFEPLKELELCKEAEFWIGMATSSAICGKVDQAVECYELLLQEDETNIEAKTQLSKLYTQRGDKELALKLAREAVSAAMHATPTTQNRRYERREDKLRRRAAEAAYKRALKLNRPRPPRNSTRRQIQSTTIHPNPKPIVKEPKKKEKRKSKRVIALETEMERQEKSLQFYTSLVSNTALMRSGDKAAVGIWMDCAQSLIEDFRQNRAFYNSERHDLSKNNESRAKKPGSPQAGDPRDTIGEDNDRGFASQEHRSPATYQNIACTEWLDIFLEYAILLTNSDTEDDTREECYGVIGAAIDCAIWYHDPQSMLQIHLCYLVCAIAFRDQETLFNTVLRWFMRQFQFCKDAYRLFAATNLLFPYPNKKGGKESQMQFAAFKIGPSQKFLLRQIKAIDNQLPTDYNIDGEEGPVPEFMRNERDDGATEVSKEAGITFKPVEMDVVLLTIYAQALYASGSFLNAISYLYRAYAIDSKNPMVLLSIALCYMHETFKRQTENRHMCLLQGWAFFQEYEDARMEWANDKGEHVIAEARQEIEFNRARTWHMLGLNDLAARTYEKVSENRAEANDDVEVGEYSMEAAYAMQTIYAFSGNTEMARHVTEKYLVVE